MVDASSANAIGWFMVAMAGFAHGLNQLLALTDRWKEKPVPSQTYATKQECASRHQAAEQRIEKMEAEISAVRIEIRAGLERMNQMDEQRAVALHNRINPMEAGMEANTKVLELLNQRLEHLDSKLDRALTKK
jgi:hypothetical protein